MTAYRVARRFFRGPLFLHAAVFLALTMWSWRKWPDPLVDFGRELYLPWQLTSGKVLYRDIASLFGPFSPYLNALWFRLFGVSLTTLAVCNLAILGATVAGIHHLLRASTDRATATAGSLVTLLLFGFSQYTDVGNYNFVSPYSHEATHGTALAVAVMVLLYHGISARRNLLCGFSGLVFGLLLLTKAETSLAMIAATGVGLGAAWMLGGDYRRAARDGLLFFGCAAAVGPVLFLLFFWTRMPLAAAALGTAGSWVTLLTTGVARSDFYQRGMGLDHPILNTLRMLKLFGGFLGFVVVLSAADHFWPAAWRSSPWASGVAKRRALLGVLLLVCVFLGSALFVPWVDLPRVLPLVSITAFATVAALFLNRRHDPGTAVALLPLLMWSAFGVVLLAKMFLNARLYHYGFYLALPATLVLVVVVLWLVPQFLAGRGAHGLVFRTVSGLVIAAGVAVHLALSHGIYRSKTLPIGSGPDRFFAVPAPRQPQGAAVLDAVARIQRLTPPDATLVVVPEGVMINYLARRQNPSPYVNFMPPEVLAFGEVTIRRALEAAPPDYILFVDRDTSEYGVGPFGSDPRYGRDIMNWVQRHYESIDVAGAESGQRMELFKRVAIRSL